MGLLSGAKNLFRGLKGVPVIGVAITAMVDGPEFIREARAGNHRGMAEVGGGAIGGGVLGAVAASATMGAVAGSVAPGIGTAIGLVSGAGFGFLGYLGGKRVGANAYNMATNGIVPTITGEEETTSLAEEAPPADQQRTLEEPEERPYLTRQTAPTASSTEEENENEEELSAAERARQLAEQQRQAAEQETGRLAQAAQQTMGLSQEFGKLAMPVMFVGALLETFGLASSGSTERFMSKIMSAFNSFKSALSDGMVAQDPADPDFQVDHDMQRERTAGITMTPETP